MTTSARVAAAAVVGVLVVGGAFFMLGRPVSRSVAGRPVADAVGIAGRDAERPSPTAVRCTRIDALGGPLVPGPLRVRRRPMHRWTSSSPSEVVATSGGYQHQSATGIQISFWTVPTGLHGRV